MDNVTSNKQFQVQQSIPCQSQATTVQEPQIGESIDKVSNSHLNPSSSSHPIEKKGVIYAPFVSDDIVEQCLGKNLSRYASGKPLRPVIVGSDAEKLLFEQIRNNKLTEYKRESTEGARLISQGTSNCSQYQYRVLIGDQLLSRQDPSLVAIHTTNGTLDVFKEKIGKDFLDKMLEGDRKNQLFYDVLSKIEVKSNSNNAELSRLDPDSSKIYITGHGASGVDILAADEKCSQGMVSSKDVAKQFKSGGLSDRFVDFRVTACHSAESRDVKSFQPDEMDDASKTEFSSPNWLSRTFLNRKPEVIREPFAQSLSKALASEGFSGAQVTGYHGKGMTLREEHQMRGINSSISEVRSSSAKREFKS
ncbi:hypothetical protein [Dongshaea marina]|uniref:hypothetical protein n=1 Tax=Dongshaea marina TaxID=2047966 RepID=UPI000D3EB31C|nr:hypothetical protein [Dongshaea marina]